MISNQNSQSAQQVKKAVHRPPFYMIRSRLANAYVLSYYGFHHEVRSLMWLLNSKSRKFFESQSELKGFVVQFDAIQILKQAHKDKKLQKYAVFQHIDLEKVSKELEFFNMQSEKIESLKKTYPYLFIYLMTRLGKNDEVFQYVKWCKGQEHEEACNYWLYVHGYLITSLLEYGELRQLKTEEGECFYIEKYDEQGRRQKIRFLRNDSLFSIDSFQNGIRHGLCKYLCNLKCFLDVGVSNNDYLIYELKYDEAHGRFT